MKKILAIILMMTMVISLFAACGNDAPADNVVDPDFNDNTAIDNNSDNNDSVQNNNSSTNGFASSKEEFIEKIGKLVDMSLYKVDYEEDDCFEIDLKIENQKSFNFDYTIKIGNDKVTIPVSFADMKNSAFSTEIAENYAVSNKVEKGPVYTTADGKEFTLWTTNLDAYFDDTETECDIKDCTLYKFSVEVYDDTYDDNNVTVYEKNDTVPDFNIHGITPDSTVEDVISAMGIPTYITYYKDGNSIDITYSEKIGNSDTSADYSSLDISFHADQNRIEYVEYEYAPAAVK